MNAPQKNNTKKNPLLLLCIARKLKQGKAEEIKEEDEEAMEEEEEVLSEGMEEEEQVVEEKVEEVKPERKEE